MAMLPVFFPVSRETVIRDAFADDCVHNPAEFELFNFTYDSVEDAIKDRLLQLERAAEQERKTAALRRQANVPAGV